MKYTEFYPPTGKMITNVSFKFMHDYIIEKFKEYWSQGTGSAEIHYLENEFSATLSISVNLDYGFYFNYSNNKQDEKEKLSLFDFGKLNEIIEGIDDLEVSLGLFVPPIQAWEIIKFFLEKGQLSPQIKWIEPENLPENSKFY